MSADIDLDPRLVGVISVSGYRGEADSIDTIRRLGSTLGWHDAERGAFGRVISAGERVVVKPNLVLHENQGPWGIEPLVTAASLIRAVTHEALRAGAASVVVGDAPIQGCDFDLLLARTGLDVWAADLSAAEPRFTGVLDFRRTTCTFVDGLRVATEDLQPAENFVLFDLGGESLLEPVTDDRGMGRFRVTCYDPRLMRATHARRRHRYLVAKHLMEADVVINLPKLKTHKKAGITCALKNLVGINGNKEFLPHHRVGSARQGGDCYESSSLLRRSIEYALDRQNMTQSRAAARVLHTVTRQLYRLGRVAGLDTDTEGSWSGNDTVWRMCLDLNRILLYGGLDASLADTPRRRVVHVADGIVAGQGNGPLSPEPLELDVLVGGVSAPAVDWVGARLLNYDPGRVALVREAFGTSRWPLATFAPAEIALAGSLGDGNAHELLGARGGSPPVKHPPGWRDASVPENGARDTPAVTPRELIVE